jgi:hypothetical protein
MRKRLKALWNWFLQFLKDYLPWTGTDQFLDSIWGRRFLAVLGGAIVTGAGWLVSFFAHLPSGWTYGFLGAFVAATAIAVFIFFFSPSSPTQRQPKSRYISGATGFFDSMVNMESAHKAFLNVMSKIARTQNELTAQIKSCTAEMERIKQSGRNVFPRMRKAAQRAARYTNDAATEYEKNLPEMAESVSFYFDGQLMLIGRTDPTNTEQKAFLQKLREIVGNLRKNTADNRAAQRAYVKALETSRGFSQDLNSALDRMAEKVVNTIAVLDDVEGRCDAVIAAIDSKLTSVVP